MSRSVDRWYRRISFKANCPGRARFLAGVPVADELVPPAGVAGEAAGPPGFSGRGVAFFLVLVIAHRIQTGSLFYTVRPLQSLLLLVSTVSRHD